VPWVAFADKNPTFLPVWSFSFTLSSSISWPGNQRANDGFAPPRD
jgi:hypothetical protein